ncbi:DHH family phosphoesterase, partial [Streptobacillus moniliformis]
LNINYVEDISSTCELLYKFLDVFNIELDEKIAKFMYLGIINDTGNFRHSNVTENTFDVASKLMKVGVDNREITNILFSKSREKV